LQAFWASHVVELPTPRMFHGRGDNVLLQAELPLPDGTVRTMWLLYRFKGTTLIEAVAFEDEAEARSSLGRSAED
jgi:hypothetical protein